MMFGKCYKQVNGKIGIVSRYEGNVTKPTGKSGSNARIYFLTTSNDITIGVYDNYGNPLNGSPRLIGLSTTGIKFKPNR